MIAEFDTYILHISVYGYKTRKTSTKYSKNQPLHTLRIGGRTKRVAVYIAYMQYIIRDLVWTRIKLGLERFESVMGHETTLINGNSVVHGVNKKEKILDFKQLALKIDKMRDYYSSTIATRNDRFFFFSGILLYKCICFYKYLLAYREISLVFCK